MASNVVGLMLVKKDSSRLPRKNYRKIAGKPMFLWNLEKCLRVFDKTYVSSDYDRILNKAEELGAIPVMRPKRLCGNTPNIKVYKHAIKQMGDIHAFVAVQANSPTLDIDSIGGVRDMMAKMYIDEIITCHWDSSLYGSIWAMTAKRLRNYKDPYNPEPDVLIIDNSVDIHTLQDFKLATDDLKHISNHNKL